MKRRKMTKEEMKVVEEEANKTKVRFDVYDEARNVDFKKLKRLLDKKLIPKKNESCVKSQ